MASEHLPGKVASAMLPTGTVAFLFTDIEGSTQRWDAHRVAMAEAVRRHDFLGRATITARHGHIFKTLGDAFCCAFTRPEDAVAAALDFQRALAAEDFSAVGGLSIRAAVHVGAADERDADYFGPTVNRVARLLAIAYGGQIIVSGVAHDLVADALPSQTAFKDLGSHRLKDLSRPEQVYQLVAPGLRADFPPLRSLAALPNNLPTELTSFVGRDREVAEITALLESSRLVTITGTGGVGKTRTSLQVAANLLDGSGDGVWFVELAPLTDSSLIASTIANAIGITLPSALEPKPALVAALKSKTMLIVFDNCEHIVAGAADIISGILHGAPNVTVLASSRQGLGIAGEETYRMPSLGVPTEAESATLDASNARRFGGIALFADRATAADKRFTLTDENAPVVADIVRRLDGIALAIELAAPRVKVLDLRQLDKRLDERFRILTGGSRDLLPRQQTLRALIDWSYDLLEDREKILFQRVGIFADGFTLEAAVAVCCDETLDELDLFDVLASLVDKSLVVAEPSADSTRYRLLESTRAYAMEKLSDASDRSRIARRHLAWVKALVQTAHDISETTLREDAYEALEVELGNIRAAIDWSKTSGDTVEGAAIVACAATRAFREFGSVPEWVALLSYFIEALPSDRFALLSMLHGTDSSIADNLGRKKYAMESAQRSLACARASGDAATLATALIRLANTLTYAQRFDEAEAALAESEAFGGPVLLPRVFVHHHMARGILAMLRGNTDEALRMYEQIFAKYREVGAPITSASIVGNVAESEHARGNTERAIAVAKDSLQNIRSRSDRASLLMNLAGYLLAVDDVKAARAAAEESLTLLELDGSDSVTCAFPIEHLALVNALEGDPARAARLLGYTSQRFAQMGIERQYTELVTYNRLRALLEEKLRPEEITRYEAEGRELTPREARQQGIAPAVSPPPGSSQLS